MNVVVLAGSIREANAYALDKGIRVRYANLPSDIKTATKVIELPGFAQRRDRFTLEQALTNRQRFGTPVEYEWESEWVRPVMEVEPEHDPAADRRDRLVNAANEAIDALAADLGVLPQHLIDSVASNSHTEIASALKPQSVTDREESGEPANPAPEPYGVATLEQVIVGQLDLTDEVTLAELKAELNQVGLTLKKVPAKLKELADAKGKAPEPDELNLPKNDAPVEF